jgi:hypothetical protein
MVRLAGIEPTTPWFVAKYSIQLSYSRTASHLNTQSALKKFWWAPRESNTAPTDYESAALTKHELGARIWSFYALIH